MDGPSPHRTRGVPHVGSQVSEAQPLSAFIRLMRDALKAIEDAKTPEERRDAEHHMAILIRAQNRREQ
jgi:hypothetical protein